MNSDVIERIKKLLKLSTSSNEHEAALAAQRAAELMRAHNIAEAQLRVDEPTACGPERTVQAHDPGINKRAARWQGHLVGAAAKLYNCYVWINQDGHRRLFGRESDVQAASYTAQYLIAEVSRLSKVAWKASPECALDAVSARSWQNNFCLGAAVTIWQRCDAAHRERLEKAYAESQAAESGPVTALQVVARDELAVRKEYAQFSARFGRSRRSGARVTQASAYSQGQAAGATVGLGGGRTRGLGAGQGQLR